MHDHRKLLLLFKYIKYFIKLKKYLFMCHQVFAFQIFEDEDISLNCRSSNKKKNNIKNIDKK